jgi:hypothetical protein
MPAYVLAYYGEPRFEGADTCARHMAKWEAWISSLGDALVNPGTPLGEPETLGRDGASDRERSNRLTGFSIVNADSMVAALEMARRCPHLEHGTVDVAEVMDMGGRHERGA